MADLKISALTASTTPLAGTEVLPIVQSGATVKVSVANLTAGRAVSTGALSVIGANATLDNAYSLAGKLAAGSPVGMIQRNSSDQVAIDPDGYGTVIGFSGARLQVTSGNATLQNGNFVVGTSGKGIDFSATAGTGTSELLADYEEGTWTPSDQSGAGLTFTSADGYYTKIGREVFAHFYITYPVTVDASNNAFGGLPFTAANTNAARGGSALTYSEFNTVSSIYGPKNNTIVSVTDGVGNSRTNAVMSGKTIMGCIIYFV